MSNDTQNNDWLQTVVQSCLSKLSPVSAALVACVAIAFGIFQSNSSTCEVKPSPDPTQVTQQYNSRADYERLKLGMTSVEVESILGRGIEIERSLSAVKFIWTNADDSSITAVFKDGRLESKYQSQLRQ